MDNGLISHVGVAVSDIEASSKIYSLITGIAKPEVIEVPDQKVRVAMFGGHGSARIELVAPTSLDSPVAKFIAKRGEGLHHICILVDDLGSMLEELKSSGIRLIDEEPRIGAGGVKIAFVHPSSAGGVLLELEERAPGK